MFSYVFWGCTHLVNAIRLSRGRVEGSIPPTPAKALVTMLIRRLFSYALERQGRDTPYEAWVVVSEGVRKARLLGLFGSWTGQLHKRK